MIDLFAIKKRLTELEECCNVDLWRKWFKNWKENGIGIDMESVLEAWRNVKYWSSRACVEAPWAAMIPMEIERLTFSIYEQLQNEYYEEITRKEIAKRRL